MVGAIRPRQHSKCPKSRICRCQPMNSAHRNPVVKITIVSAWNSAQSQIVISGFNSWMLVPTRSSFMDSRTLEGVPGPNLTNHHLLFHKCSDFCVHQLQPQKCPRVSTGAQVLTQRATIPEAIISESTVIRILREHPNVRSTTNAQLFSLQFAKDCGECLFSRLCSRGT